MAKITFHPHLDHPKNFPGDIDKPGVSKMFGGKMPKQGGKEGKVMTKDAKMSKDQHGLHGAVGKKPRATPKQKSK